MQKANGHIRAVLSRMILFGLSIQIVLGILWMGCNFGRFQEFGESRFYIGVSKNFLFDEYTGALYPVLLMLARGIEEILPIPYTYVIQTLQLVAAFISGYVFLGALGVRKTGYGVLGSMAILTVPMAMQCHLAVLPHSLTLSAFLLEMSFVAEGVRGNQPLRGEQLVKANACWLVSALLMPDYLYLGLIPVLLWWAYDTWKYGRQKGKTVFGSLLLIAAFGGMIAGSEELFQEPGCYGRPAKTMDVTLFQRFTWGFLVENWDEVPEDMKECCPEEFVTEASFYAENMEQIPARLEATLGQERAREIYRELNRLVLDRNRGEILRRIVWDAAGYAAPAAVLPMFLTGRGYDSYAGINYGVMKRNTPILTKYYVDYSGWWLVAGVLLSGIGMLCSFLSWLSLRKQAMEKQTTGKEAVGRTVAIVAISIFTAVVMIVWYTMQGSGVWDYKNGLFVGTLWITWMLLSVNGMTCGIKD